MKNSQMMAMLENDPKLKFVGGADKHNYYAALNNIGRLSYFDKNTNKIAMATVLTIDHEWEIYRPSVTWQEALQAWIDGGTITMEKCQGYGKNCTDCVYFHGKKLSLRSGDCLKDMCQEMFSTGTWYIATDVDG